MSPRITRPPKTVDELAKAYRDRLIQRRTEPPPSPEQRSRDRADRLMKRLERTETSLERSDQKRLRDLLEYARVQADMGDLTAVYGAAAEVCQMARTRLLGLRMAHPVIAAPATRPPSLPPDVEEDESEPP